MKRAKKMWDSRRCADEREVYHNYGHETLLRIDSIQDWQKGEMQKEPKNPFDSEAIRVTLKHIGTVGYVANSPYTGATGTMSAGRIYEKVGKKFKAEVMFITSSKVICRVIPEDEEGKCKSNSDTEME